jgi:hypothetical protein
MEESIADRFVEEVTGDNKGREYISQGARGGDSGDFGYNAADFGGNGHRRR